MNGSCSGPWERAKSLVAAWSWAIGSLAPLPKPAAVEGVEEGREALAEEAQVVAVPDLERRQKALAE